MKKKGFTLIELLAVIVILAIIALIATPIVMNVIESSRKGAAERSYENYLRAVETAIAEERINGPIEDGTYEVMSDGSLCKGTISGTDCTGTKLSVEVSGTKPATGSTVKVENGLITKGNDTTLSIGDYTVKYNPATSKVEAIKDESGETVVLKTFSIFFYEEDTMSFQFEEGMTWGEFVDSPYNTINEFTQSPYFTKGNECSDEYGNSSDDGIMFDKRGYVYGGESFGFYDSEDFIKEIEYEIFV